MLYILLGIIIAIVLIVVLFKNAENLDDGLQLCLGILATCLSFVTALAVVVYIFYAWEWKASEYKAKIINQEYGTNYTKEEVFYASSVIEAIKQLERQRIEVKADINQN